MSLLHSVGPSPKHQCPQHSSFTGQEWCGGGVVPSQTGNSRLLCVTQVLNGAKPQQMLPEDKLSPEHNSAILDSRISLEKDAQARARSKHPDTHDLI